MSRPKRIISVLYEEVADERGNIQLQKITTSQWLTVEYIANTMGVSYQTMNRLIVDSQVMPYTRVGVQIRVAASDFADYLKKCQTAEYERPGAK